jgi:hypothetical protein
VRYHIREPVWVILKSVKKNSRIKHDDAKCIYSHGKNQTVWAPHTVRSYSCDTVSHQVARHASQSIMNPQYVKSVQINTTFEIGMNNTPSNTMLRFHTTIYVELALLVLMLVLLLVMHLRLGGMR